MSDLPALIEDPDEVVCALIAHYGGRYRDRLHPEAVLMVENAMLGAPGVVLIEEGSSEEIVIAVAVPGDLHRHWLDFAIGRGVQLKSLADYLLTVDNDDMFAYELEDLTDAFVFARQALAKLPFRWFSEPQPLGVEYDSSRDYFSCQTYTEI